MIDILKMGFKLLFFTILLGAVGFFTNFLIGQIPPINLGGCMGWWANALGIFLGLKILVSIVLYGFVAKFTLSYFSNYLN